MPIYATAQSRASCYNGPLGGYRIFADGFAGGNFTVAGAAHRPVGLAQGPNGEHCISDDQAGWIWRVSYVGGR